MSEKTVWVIERGEYSDYRVMGVFSSKENAERVAEAINAADSYSTATIAEWQLDPVVGELAKGFKPYYVRMHKDGQVESVRPSSMWTYEMGGRVNEWEREEAPAYKGAGLPNLLCVDTWARDEKHAVKIANEHRIQWLALGKWKGNLPPPPSV
jgi:hypothetical protein